MPIDNCTYTFEELAETVLPRHFQRLQLAMKKPIPAESLVGHKSFSREVTTKLDKQADFPGCYVFINEKTPEYVGISRHVVGRLLQHLNYDSHNSSPWVYRMALKDYPHEMKRDQAMKDEKFKKAFLLRQESLRPMKIAWVEIENDLELYAFEVFAAMRLDTYKWNTFRTH
jgi:hypothetical protein